MIIAHDLFAETNPAFCTFGLVSFCQKYSSAAGKPPSLALAYLALPIALSDDLHGTFERTTTTTGMLSWLNRYPDIRVDLGERLDASKDIVSGAIRFGLSTRALVLETDGSLSRGTGRFPQTSVARLPQNPKRVLKRAERLGTWMGKAGSAATIFSAFGVTP